MSSLQRLEFIKDLKGLLKEVKTFAKIKADKIGINKYNKALDKAWAVINHNSNVGTVAALNGVPVFVGPDSYAAPVGNLDLSNIENPNMPDREVWIRKLAQCHWSFDDLRSGRCWAHMRQWVKHS